MVVRCGANVVKIKRAGISPAFFHIIPSAAISAFMSSISSCVGIASSSSK